MGECSLLPEMVKKGGKLLASILLLKSIFVRIVRMELPCAILGSRELFALLYFATMQKKAVYA